MVRVYKVPVLKPVMDVLMALSKAFPMNLVLLIFYLIWTTQFSSIAAFFHSQKTIKDVSLMYVAILQSCQYFGNHKKRSDLRGQGTV